MKKLFKWVKPYPMLLLTAIVLSIIVPVTYTFVPQFIKYVFDYVLDSNPEATTTLPKFLVTIFENSKAVSTMYCVIVVGFTLVVYQIIRGSLMLLNGYVKGVFGENITLTMRKELFNKIQDLSYSYHNNVDTGDLIQRCTSDIDTAKVFLSTEFIEIFYTFAAFIASAIQMAAIDYRIMLVTLIIVPISLISSVIYFHYMSKRFEQIEEAESDMTSCIEENIKGIRVVKSFAQEKSEIDKFSKKNENFKKQNEKFSIISGVFWGISDGLSSLQYAITIGFCIYLSEKGSVTIGDVVVCLSYISLLIYPIRGLGRIINNFGKAKIATKRIDEILSLDSEYLIDGNETPEIKGNIEFKNVTFKFADADKPMINDLSFDIKQGETIAIVGKTGCGKSTITHLLERLLEYDSGQILIDGVELKKISKKWIRSHIGIVMQDPFLYGRSIEENIKIASDNASMEDVTRASSMAHVHNDIMSFDKKYETEVGENGVTLSGGQKQRVAIARLLINSKPIIIFDDSLSAVDTQTDKAIRTAIKENLSSSTVIIITHRITTAKATDRIIVLDNGHVSEIGTHKELSKIPGIYKELWDIQGNIESEFIKLKDGDNNE